MALLPLRYVHAYVDRHGHPRHYFRKAGCKRAALPGDPGSREFMAAYQRALDGVEEAAPAPQRHRPAEGSADVLVRDFYASAGFLALRASSQRVYRGVLERFRAEHGEKPVALLNRKGVLKILASASSPMAANYLRRILRLLMAFAVEEGLCDDNPVLSVKASKIKSDGYHTWTEEEIEQFEAVWPIGTQARLAMALQLYTGQRRSDVVKMTWRDISGGKIRVTQIKTGTRLRIRIHPELRRVLDGSPKTNISILVTSYGAAFDPNSYGMWFKTLTRKAGLPYECASHGLRKAAARRLAEAGCSTHQIAAVTGHRSLKEIERYTKEVDQERMADEAIDKVANVGKKPLEASEA